MRCYPVAFFLIYLTISLMGCTRGSEVELKRRPLESSAEKQASSSPASNAEGTPPNSRDVPGATTKVILFLGDSLTQGYGVQPEQAYPELMERAFKAKGRDVRSINGGISGSVTAEADARLRFYLSDPTLKPDVLVLVLGANDALKGTPPKVVKENLRKALLLAREKNLPVVLGGMKIFSNYGKEYGAAFAKIYPELAKEFNTKLIPFFLEGVALKKEFNIEDGRHPNAAGHALLAETVMKYVEPLL